jgi:hypothetical protein
LAPADSLARREATDSNLVSEPWAWLARQTATQRPLALPMQMWLAQTPQAARRLAHRESALSVEVEPVQASQEPLDARLVSPQ